jgi:catechol 2,3-dioxygenase-like lactoylglutathione lyase family enzyme
MIKALDAVEVLTLFAEDLRATEEFYEHVFGHEVVYKDDACSVLKFGAVMINLLKATEAPALVGPEQVAPPGMGARCLLTIKVADADAVCEDLRRHGVTLLNGPRDRPWGRRTAAFSDPAGNIWEIAQDLPGP